MGWTLTRRRGLNRRPLLQTSSWLPYLVCIRPFSFELLHPHPSFHFLVAACAVRASGRIAPPFRDRDPPRLSARSRTNPHLLVGKSFVPRASPKGDSRAACISSPPALRAATGP